MSSKYLSLFEGYGIEIEHALVDAESFDVRPVADEVLRAAAGSDCYVDDFEDGPIGWSNELVMHVLEMKTNGPIASFEGVAKAFENSVQHIDKLLAPLNARALGTGAHPWMNPRTETHLWPHSNAEIYGAYDRLFDCKRHGWANLQSVHVNLPFSNDEEFGRLMAAVRLVLPLIPALAASTPVLDGKSAGALDGRLQVYRNNSVRCPSMTAEVIPEPVFEPAEYRRVVFEPIDRELAQLGADQVLFGAEWTNARGAIARFDRMAIEIRLIDAQECPRMDLAVAAAVAGLVKSLALERWSTTREQRDFPSSELVALLDQALVYGPQTPLQNAGYARLFGLDLGRADNLRDFWRLRAEESSVGSADLQEPLAFVLREGVLAERILRALNGDFSRDKLRAVYANLANCLRAGRPFES